MADDGGNTEKETDKKIVHVYPLVKVNKIKNYLKNCHIKINIYIFFGNVCTFSKHSDMNEEMRTEAIELSITACEKYASNYEVSLFFV